MTSRLLRRHTRRFSTAVGDAAIPKFDAASKLVHSPALFPWRHDTKPLSRLKESPGSHSGLADMSAYFLLDYPAWGTLFGGSSTKRTGTISKECAVYPFKEAWSLDLAESSAFAFVQGVNGICNNVYSVSCGDRASIDFEYNTDKDGTLTDNKDSDDGTAATSPASSKESKLMMTQPLIDLYKSAHESGKNLQVRLVSEPIEWRLYDLLAMPVINRDLLKTNPETLKTIMNTQYKINNGQGSISEHFTTLRAFVERSADTDASDMQWTTTMEIQVILLCNESFQVIDKDTGAVIQGTEDYEPQPVYHLVRLEADITASQIKFPSIALSFKRPWRITDIDDLTCNSGSNKTYLKAILDIAYGTDL